MALFESGENGELENFTAVFRLKNKVMENGLAENQYPLICRRLLQKEFHVKMILDHSAKFNAYQGMKSLLDISQNGT